MMDHVMNVDFRNQKGIKVEIEYRGRGMIDRLYNAGNLNACASPMNEAHRYTL